MRTLKTSLAIFPVEAVIMATLTKNGHQTVNIHNICSPLYDLYIYIYIYVLSCVDLIGLILSLF